MRKISDPAAEFAKVRTQFTEASKEKGFNLLLYGDSGTGKTYSLRTARKPVFIHSFDPGGSRCLTPWINEGEIIVDSRFESEDAAHPSAYMAWEREFNRLRATDFFSHVGTFVLDSVTTWDEALLNEIVRKNPKNTSGEPPQLRDYGVNLVAVRDALKLCAGLPCDFIAIGHLGYDKDEETGRMVAGPMMPGKLTAILPMIFDEVWIAQVKRTKEGRAYKFLTQNDGFLRARSRLAGYSKILPEEDPDFKAILMKADIEMTDKPLFMGAEAVG